MIFNKEFDSILLIIFESNGINSKEIARFIKYISPELILKIRNSLDKISENSSISSSYGNTGKWEYKYKIDYYNGKKSLTISKLIEDVFKEKHPLILEFSLCLNYNQNKNINNIKNYDSTLLAVSRWRKKGKINETTYTLKKFPSEYMISKTTRRNNKYDKINYTVKKETISHPLTIETVDNRMIKTKKLNNSNRRLS